MARNQRDHIFGIFPRISPVRDGILVAVVLIATALLSIAAILHAARDAFDREVRQHLLDVAEVCAGLVDVTDLEIDDYIGKNGPSPEGIADRNNASAVIDRMDSVLRTNDGLRLSHAVIRARGELHVMTHDGASVHPAGSAPPQLESEMLATLHDGRARSVALRLTDGETFGSRRTYAPVRDDAGQVVGVIGVDVPATAYQHRLAPMYRAARWSVVPAIVLAMLAGVGIFALRRSTLIARNDRERLIADLRSRELAQRESEQRLRSLIEATPACVKVIAADGTLREMNGQGLAMIEADDAASVIGCPITSVIAPEHRDAYKAFHQRICRGERAELEFEIIGLRGTRRWMHSYAAPLLDEQTGAYLHIAITHDVTDRKRADAELALSRDRFEMMTRATLDVVWDLDLATGEAWWNENLNTTFGHDPATIDRTATWWTAHIHPDDRERVVASFDDIMRDSRQLWTEEYRFRRADGSYAHVFDRAFVIRDGSGEAVRIVGAMMDLTEQRAAAEEMAFQKTLLECQTEASLDGILVISNDRKVLSYNQRFVDLWNIPEDAFTSSDDNALLDTVLGNLIDPDAFLARIRELYEHPDWESTDEIHLRDGRVFHRYSAAVRNTDGVDYGRVWFFRDITEHKRYEERLAEHKLVIENSNAVLFRWRAAEGWPVDLVSDNIAQFGYDAEAMLNGRINFASIVHPDDLERVGGEVQAHCEQNHDTFEQEYRLICRDGTVRWIYDRTPVERDDNGRVHHFQGIVIDITDRKESEAQLQRLLDELKEREKENSTLIDVLRMMHEGKHVVGTLVQRIADAIPAGFLDPARTAVRIRLGDQLHDSPGYRDESPQHAADFVCDDRTEGEIRVVILDGQHDCDDTSDATDGAQQEPAILAEERQLIDTIADALRAHLDRMRVEEQLRNHKVVVENSSAVLFRWRIDPDWPVELVTENVAQFGYSAGELMSGAVRFDDIVHPDDRRRIENEVLDCHKKNIESVEQEYRIVCRDGTIRWVYDRTRAERDDSGAMTHYQGVVIDITERKNAQLLQDVQKHVLEQIATSCDNSDVFSTLITMIETRFPTARCSILLLDPDTNRLQHAAAPNLPASFIRAIDGVTIGPDVGSCGAAAHRRTRVIVEDIETNANWKRGRDAARDAGVRSCWSEPILDASGAVLGTFAIYKDRPDSPSAQEIELIELAAHLAGIAIDRKRAERALHDALHDAEAANRAKSEFLANMSHEIRTPMTAILGYADLMAGDDTTTTQRQEYVTTIRRNGEHLLSIINDILDNSKIEAGHMVCERIAFTPYDVVQDVVYMMQPRAASRNLGLRIDVADPLPPKMIGDPTRVRQVLVNLIGNAIKFTELGGVTIRLSCPRDTDSGHHRFTVAVIDTGIGMSASNIAQIFKPFKQADAHVTRRFGGTGLGLAISKRLVHLMGGDIDVTSEPGRGSTFTIWIDAGELDESTFTTPEPRRTPTPTPTDASSLPTVRGRVLFAEDGPDNQRLIRFYLEKAGLNVDLVENGERAVERVNEAMRLGETYDLILMDMQMPVMDGYTATEQIRAAGCDWPIIALTAHAMRGDREKCMDVGCNEYLSKPIGRQRLLDTIAEWTSGAPAEK